MEQDPDVLDTWFSSALWPLSTMGWPEPESFDDTTGLLDTFNPTSVLCTGRDIITLWVSRMVMFNRFFTDDGHGGRVPFRHVYIHPMIQDGHGQKMSKSLGNGVDPRDIIHSHGADAMRYTLVEMATTTQDSRLPVDLICPHCDQTVEPKEIASPTGYRVAAPEQTCPKCKNKMVSGYGAMSGTTPTNDMPLARNSSSKFDKGRNFANKLWNAVRFALGNLQDGDGFEQSKSLADLSLVDRWMITRLHRTLHEVEDAIQSYQFDAYARAMYDLVWRDFCDWYLESIKPTIKDNPAQQQVLRTVLNAMLRILHPICPFVTETLWPHVTACGFAGLEGLSLPQANLLAGATWPKIACSMDDPDAATTFQRIQHLVTAIRQVRSQHDVPPKRLISLHGTDKVRALIDSSQGTVQTLTNLESVEPIPNERPADAVPITFEGEELLLTNLKEKVDIDAERARLDKLIVDREKNIAGFKAKLNNEKYVAKAPPQLVSETRKMLSEAETHLDVLKKALKSLEQQGS